MKLTYRIIEDTPEEEAALKAMSPEDRNALLNKFVKNEKIKTAAKFVTIGVAIGASVAAVISTLRNSDIETPIIEA